MEDPLKLALVGFFVRVGKYYPVLSGNPPWGVRHKQTDADPLSS